MQAGTAAVGSTRTLREWRDVADLVSVASASIPSLRPVRGEDGYRGVCPFHAGATNPTSFHVYTTKEGDWRYICYSCGAKGDSIAYIAEREGCSYREAFRRVRDGALACGGAITPRRPATPEPSVLPPHVRAIWNYHAQLGKTSTLGMTGKQWWMQRGLDANTISRFQLGYAPRCPTYVVDKDGQTYHSDSFVIPVVYRGEVQTIRHRVASPLDPKDKYRPEYKGLGAHLFNADSLDVAGGGDVLIVEGEAKAMALIALGIESIMPVVSSTAGVASWLKAKGQDWYRMLYEFDRVFVLFDNERKQADVVEQTARLFGRRGYIVRTPGKVDDWLRRDSDAGTRLSWLLEALSGAQRVLR